MYTCHSYSLCESFFPAHFLTIMYTLFSRFTIRKVIILIVNYLLSGLRIPCNSNCWFQKISKQYAYEWQEIKDRYHIQLSKRWAGFLLNLSILFIILFNSSIEDYISMAVRVLSFACYVCVCVDNTSFWFKSSKLDAGGSSSLS